MQNNGFVAHSSAKILSHFLSQHKELCWIMVVSVSHQKFDLYTQTLTLEQTSGAHWARDLHLHRPLCNHLTKFAASWDI